MVYNFQLVNESAWGIDSNPYFKGGKGFWAKEGKAEQEFKITADTFGPRTISLHVRTGANSSKPEDSTNLLSSYSLTFEGVGIPLTLDQSRPPEWKGDIFGGAWMGYLNGTITIADKVEKSLKLKVETAYSAYDGLFIPDTGGGTGGGNEGYEQGYLDGERARKEKDQSHLNEMFLLPE
jgi:hypothetical protein